jgi:hypothetical protein
LKFLYNLLLISAIIIFSGSQVFGQQVSVGQNPNEIISITIDETGTAHVTHKVKGPSLNPIQVDMIDGNITNLSVTDVNGGSVEYASMKSPMSIILNISQRNMTLIKYNLVNAVSNKNNIWKWDYREPQDTDFTEFHFPKGVDTVWANGRPVYLGEQGLGQHGNGFALEYIIDEPVNTQNVQFADKNFVVGVRTVSGLGGYVFDQSQKTYAFNVDKANIPITVIIPQELLSGPYNVKLNGNATLYQEFHKNKTHAWIGLEPAKSGTVQIIGTTVGQEQQSNIDKGEQQVATVGQEQQQGENIRSSSFNSIIIPVLISIIAVIIGVIVAKKIKK